MIRVLPLVLLLATPLQAHEFTAGGLEIGHPYMRDPLPTAKSAAGYLSIANTGSETDVLLGVSTDFAAASEIHTTLMEDGVARMRPVEEIEIPAGETVMLEPGGMHVMFMGLNGTADEGDMIPATLLFRDAGEVAVEFSVDAAAAAGGHDHSAHDHSDHDEHGDHAGHADR